MLGICCIVAVVVGIIYYVSKKRGKKATEKEFLLPSSPLRNKINDYFYTEHDSYLKKYASLVMIIASTFYIDDSSLVNSMAPKKDEITKLNSDKSVLVFWYGISIMLEQYVGKKYNKININDMSGGWFGINSVLDEAECVMLKFAEETINISHREEVELKKRVREVSYDIDTFPEFLATILYNEVLERRDGLSLDWTYMYLIKRCSIWVDTHYPLLLSAVDKIRI